VGHLAAGLTHAQRTGDDTLGRAWDRTRRVGVNTLPFHPEQVAEQHRHAPPQLDGRDRPRPFESIETAEI
jgi:hypothetical protein